MLERSEVIARTRSEYERKAEYQGVVDALEAESLTFLCAHQGGFVRMEGRRFAKLKYGRVRMRRYNLLEDYRALSGVASKTVKTGRYERNSEPWWQATAPKQCDALDPVHKALECKETNNHIAYPSTTLRGSTGNGNDPEAGRPEIAAFPVTLYKISAVKDMKDNSGVIPEEDEDDPLEASHGCHNDKCFALGQVYLEKRSWNHRRQVCSYRPNLPCVCGNVRKCIKPPAAMTREQVDMLVDKLRSALRTK